MTTIIKFNNETYEVTRKQDHLFTLVPFVGAALEMTSEQMPDVIDLCLWEHNRVAAISASDLEKVYPFTWTYHNRDYVVCYQVKAMGWPKKTCFLSDWLVRPDEGFCVDHIDGKGLNNARDNMRVATHSQNHANKPKPRNIKNTKTSQYKGVSWDTTTGKWFVLVACQGKQYFVGRFINEIDAANAYDDKARELFGEFAKTNFSQ